MSLATLKRKTKETYKTKHGTFSLNGHRRNMGYIGKNHAAIKSNLWPNLRFSNLSGMSPPAGR